MGIQRTLLERIADSRRDIPLTIGENKEALAESVLRNLQNMLNTRQGHVLVQPDYGMPDVTEFVQTLPELVKAVEKGIKNSIQKFEPRLKNPVITYVPAEHYQTELRFEISAELVTEREKAPVSFETEVSSSGQIKIKG